MTNLKEFFSPDRVVSNLGSSRFRSNLMKEVIMTPHERMSRVLEMLEGRPTVVNSLRKYVNYVLGDVSFTSNDKKSAEFMNEWLKMRDKEGQSIKEELYLFAFVLAATGNAYIEPTFAPSKNGSRVLDNLFHMPDPSLIYYNFDGTQTKAGEIPEDEYWLMEVPFDIRYYQGMQPKYRNVYYLRGSVISRRRIYCIALHKTKLIHKKIGWSRDGNYGNGYLSAAVDNDDILREILKNWALIAKYRALGKKIISVTNEGGDPVDQKEIDNIETKFKQLEEEDSLFINKKITSEPLTFVGENENMKDQIDWLNKDTGSGLVPSYLTPFSQDNALATAAEAKNPFYLELMSFQDTMVRFFNDVIVGEMRKAYDWLAEDLTIAFAKPDIYSREEKFSMVNQLYNMRAATFNELRVASGLEPVTGGDVWGEQPPLDKITVKVDTTPQGDKPEGPNKFPDAFKQTELKSRRK